VRARNPHADEPAPDSNVHAGGGAVEPDTEETVWENPLQREEEDGDADGDADRDEDGDEAQEQDQDGEDEGKIGEEDEAEDEGEEAREDALARYDDDEETEARSGQAREKDAGAVARTGCKRRPEGRSDEKARAKQRAT
jgi:hypothetical protein